MNYMSVICMLIFFGISIESAEAGDETRLVTQAIEASESTDMRKIIEYVRGHVPNDVLKRVAVVESWNTLDEWISSSMSRYVLQLTSSPWESDDWK